MHPLGQAIFGCLAIFTVWTIVRAMRTGVIYSKGAEFALDERPIAFGLALAVHLGIVAFCVWCAAGYDPVAFFEAMGRPVG